jgi:hypothetical protein
MEDGVSNKIRHGIADMWTAALDFCRQRRVTTRAPRDSRDTTQQKGGHAT